MHFLDDGGGLGIAEESEGDIADAGVIGDHGGGSKPLAEHFGEHGGVSGGAAEAVACGGEVFSGPELFFGLGDFAIEVHLLIDGDAGDGAGVDDEDGARPEIEGEVLGREGVEVMAGVEAGEGEADVSDEPGDGEGEGIVGDGLGEGFEACVGFAEDEGVDDAAIGGVCGGGDESGGAGVDADAKEALGAVGVVGLDPVSGGEDIEAFAVAVGDEVTVGLAVGAEIEEEDIEAAFVEEAGEWEEVFLSGGEAVAEDDGSCGPLGGDVGIGVGRVGGDGDPPGCEEEAVACGEMCEGGGEVEAAGGEGAEEDPWAVGDDEGGGVGEDDGEHEGALEDEDGAGASAIGREGSAVEVKGDASGVEEGAEEEAVEELEQADDGDEEIDETEALGDGGGAAHDEAVEDDEGGAGDEGGEAGGSE